MKEKLKDYQQVIIPAIFVFISIIFFYNDKFIIGSIILLAFIIYFYYLNKNEHSKVENGKRTISKLKLNINDNISNMLAPIALINENGDIIWANKRLTQELELSDTEGQNIISITRSLDLQKLLKCDKDLSQRIKIKNCIYSIYASKITGEDELINDVYAVYFIEVSNLRDLNTTKESVMLIEVDNLSEVLESTEESERPLLVAEVERTINLYAQKLKALIVKYDSNRYALSVIDKYITEEVNNKFDILEKISEIERGNKFELTLSIGIGRGGATPQENYNNAVTAKELALGRGGDQVAIKNNEKIIFFGGNTREFEKRTRVRARVIAHALKDLIYESSNILIMGHKNPDMDCLGAAVGLWSTIRQMGKNCNIILDNDRNAIEYYMNKLQDDSKYDNTFISRDDAEKNINEKSLLIVVDVHNKGYVSNIDLVEKVSRKIIIDHHRRSPDIVEGTLLNYIEVYASSTSEMVTELIQYMVQKPRISKVEAEGLLAGIVMDTKEFQFKAGVRTFDAASFLRSIGADTLEVKKMFNDSLEDYLVIADTIKNAEVKDNVAIAVCPSNVDNTVIVARAADELLTISGIEVCFVLAEINNNVIISGRSLGDVNVQVILEELGGGGHMNMAGAKLKLPIGESIEALRSSIDKHLK
ncbi:DHH family phosphoesterase [Clostridium sp. NSJ-6]|uniref:Cyclic-di-AMP phosphodiesterase n=1 Tax=Clostridium hominis TaxID=2763036 RepID=A0ABR7DB61_9CLOT|nr:DHH family phosphoesterase [Clostridium hominis]MBC5628630.1 DHH family phosphoesterase [Clostridium hominis]MDU2674113.1 DHH family phosphoesterase [Clostridium sp.]